MENNNKEGNWMSVPTFGDWDTKNGTMPDYSMDFSKIREMRKNNKKEISRASLGNEDDLVNKPGNVDRVQHRRVEATSDEADRRRTVQHARDHSPSGRKKILSYFNCCIRA